MLFERDKCLFFLNFGMFVDRIDEIFGVDK